MDVAIRRESRRGLCLHGQLIQGNHPHSEKVNLLSLAKDLLGKHAVGLCLEAITTTAVYGLWVINGIL